ncbi:MAG: ATP synthase F0 subunit C [Desulfobulbaceae bacterium]|nr:ATP synthase F0 subunit C [Desulfobulbaceae bacterium]MCK5437106.1 ATP synthase F0 subunit C [Desulfobulbaceae bacterium]
MKKLTVRSILSVLMLLGFATLACAAEGAGVSVKDQALYFIAAALAVGIPGAGCGIGMGTAINAACSGIARNPEAGGKIQVNMIIGLALIESLTIYGLVIALILLFM